MTNIVPQRVVEPTQTWFFREGPHNAESPCHQLELELRITPREAPHNFARSRSGSRGPVRHCNLYKYNTLGHWDHTSVLCSKSAETDLDVLQRCGRRHPSSHQPSRGTRSSSETGRPPFQPRRCARRLFLVFLLLLVGVRVKVVWQRYLTRDAVLIDITKVFVLEPV